MGGPTAWEWMFYFGMPALIQAAIISVVLSLVIWFSLKRMISQIVSSGSNEASAVEIVRGRYAKGDISRREYEQIRDDLALEDLTAQKEGAR